jgi:hypothetical protein
MRASLLIFLALQIGLVDMAFAAAASETTTREERMTAALKNFHQSEPGSYNMKYKVSSPENAKHHHKKHHAMKHHSKSHSMAGPSQ